MSCRVLEQVDFERQFECLPKFVPEDNETSTPLPQSPRAILNTYKKKKKQVSNLGEQILPFCFSKTKATFFCLFCHQFSTSFFSLLFLPSIASSSFRFHYLLFSCCLLQSVLVSELDPKNTFYKTNYYFQEGTKV